MLDGFFPSRFRLVKHGRFAKEAFKAGMTARRRIEPLDESCPFLFVERENGSVREALRSLLCAISALNHDVTSIKEDTRSCLTNARKFVAFENRGAEFSAKY